MSDIINHPEHYAGLLANVECIDITRHMNFPLGNALKYVWRAGKKGGPEKEAEDLRKAAWYIRDQLSFGFPPQEMPVAKTMAQAVAAALPDGHRLKCVLELIFKPYKLETLASRLDATANAIEQRLPQND